MRTADGRVLAGICGSSVGRGKAGRNSIFVLSVGSWEKLLSGVTYGTFAAAYEDVDHMFAYYRTNEETGQRILIAGNFGTDTVTLPLEKQADRVLLTNGKAVDEILNGNRESTSLVLGSCDCVVLLLGQ